MLPVAAALILAHILWAKTVGMHAGELDADLLELLSPWQASAEVRLRVGERDNILLSSYNPLSSPFLGLAAEGMVTRAADAGLSVEAYGTLDYRHYLDEQLLQESGGSPRTGDAGGVQEETLGLAVANGRWGVGGAWSLYGSTEYLYQDQVVDVSVNQADLSIVDVLGHTLTGRTGVRRELGERAWVELGAKGGRSLFDLPLDDTWEGGAEATGTWTPESGTELGLSWSYEHRWYDAELARTAAGGEQSAVKRENDRMDLRLTWRERWDKAEHWRTVLRIGGRLNRDPYEGYYDYDRISGEAQVRYVWNAWQLAVGPRVAWYGYDVQPSDTEEPRRRTEVAVDAGAEWKLDPRLALFVEYAWEHTFSNSAQEEYSVNTWSVGVSFLF